MIKKTNVVINLGSDKKIAECCSDNFTLKEEKGVGYDLWLKFFKELKFYWAKDPWPYSMKTLSFLVYK